MVPVIRARAIAHDRPGNFLIDDYYMHSMVGIVAMPQQPQPPSNLELQVLALLWDRGPSTVREILDQLPDGKQRAYTTILTVMQNMAKKGLVTKTSRGTAHVYQPKQTQQKTLAPILRGLLHNVFGGRVSTVMQHLLAETDVSESEMKEIRRVLDAKKKGTKPS